MSKETDRLVAELKEKKDDMPMALMMMTGRKELLNPLRELTQELDATDSDGDRVAMLTSQLLQSLSRFLPADENSRTSADETAGPLLMDNILRNAVQGSGAQIELPEYSGKTIKRIKKSAHAHHGGAWKVAYADFVTAMMAFFLLLWLLSVTTQDKRKAIADYFTPTIGIKDSKGIGVNGGRSPSSQKGKSSNDLVAPGIIIGQVQQGPVPKDPEDAKKPDPEAESSSTGKDDKQDKKDSKDSQDNQDSEQFNLAEKEIKQAMETDQELNKLKNNIQVEQTPEGLKIDLIDDPKKPMFAAGGATLSDAGKKAIDSMANIIAKTTNQIAIIGHTDAAGPTANPRYTNWELSADRANAARRALATTQLESDRVVKIIGLADRELLVKDDPSNPRNRRVTVILLRGSYSRDPNSVAPASRAILSVGDAKLKEKEPEAPPPAPPVAAGPPKPSIFDQSTPGQPKPAAE